MFALTPATAWAVDVIGDCGFEYSSSILPNLNPLHGYPGAPNEPFLWDNGLMEFPVPIAPMFGYHMPFLEWCVSKVFAIGENPKLRKLTLGD